MGKKLQQRAFCFLMLLFGFYFGFGQCPSGGIVFTTQQQVDDFAINYPSCTQAAFITVNGPNINNLNGLDTITVITGNLTIYDNPILTDINGLSSLQEIMGNLDIYNNPNLTNLQGFSSLQTVGGYLGISNMPLLSKLDGLSSLTSVGGNFAIVGNTSLVNVHGLASLQTIDGNLSIQNNPALSNLDGLNGLQSIDGSLYISGNTMLRNILGINKIASSTIGAASSGLYIINNPNLSVCNLPNICEYLSNPSNTHPRNISGNAVNCVSETAISTTCSNPCPSGNLNFSFQQTIDDFGQLYPSCTTFSESISIVGTSITNLNGFQNLTTIQGALDIQNTNLTSLAGLENLTTVASTIQLMFNAGLVNLDGLDNLNHTDRIYITQNPVLTSLHGLENLQTMGTIPFLGGFYLQQNVSLVDISALSAVNPATISDIRIADNTSLSYCNIAIVCSFIDIAIAEGCSVCVDVSNNAGNCSTTQSIDNACDTQQSISLIGSATEAGSDFDYDMVTGDGINYYLLNVFLAGSLSDYYNQYRVSFRRNHSWDEFWGLTNFPSGTATQNVQNEIFVTTPGYYDVTFNRQTGAYTFTLVGAPPAIGIVGTSLNGWDDDVFMQVRDGKNYMLLNQSFTAGEVKFRMNESWSVNWGAVQFPSGFGVQNGPNIPVNPGTYGISFNRITGQYNFINENFPCPTELFYFQRQQSIDDFGALFPHCTSFSNGIIVNGPDITNLDGLSNVENVGPFVSIFGNPMLTSTSGLSGLESINGGLTFFNNAALTTISGINNLTSFSDSINPGILKVWSNPALTSINGFNGLLNVSQDIDLSYNPQLNLITGFSGLQIVNGTISIFGNMQLQTVNGFGSVSSTGGLSIQGNPMLATIGNSFSNLTTVNGTMGIVNTRLTNLASFSGLQTVTGTLSINENLQLTDISGLQNVNPLSLPALGIVSNPNLSICNLSNICTYLNLSSTSHPRTIYGNSGSCENEAAVLSACAMGIGENELTTVKLYPNPAKDVLNFSKELKNMEIFTIDGRGVLQHKAVATQIITDKLLSGVYIFKAETIDGEKIISRFIKQ